MVMIMLSVIAAIGMSRFADSSGYDRRTVVQFWLQILRQGQQVALARAADASARLTVVVATDQWNASTTASGGTSLQSSWPRSGLLLYQGSGSASSNCSGMALVSSSLQLSFDGDGNLAGGQSLALCINTSPVIHLCVSSTGFAYEGLCQTR